MDTAKAKKITHVMIFTTPGMLRQIADDMQKAFDNRCPGKSNVVSTIYGENEDVMIDVCFDQSRMEKNEETKRMKDKIMG